MSEYMNVAIKEALRGMSDGQGGPFGAVVVCKGKIVASAHNTVLSSKDPTSHAEISAIRKASKILNRFNLSDCELYTTGKPCPMCKSAIRWAKIKKVYYGCDYNDAQKIGFDETKGNSDKYVEKRMGRKECLQLYEKYRKEKHKKY